MAKVFLGISIDPEIAMWLKEKDGKKSAIVNQYLKAIMFNELEVERIEALKEKVRKSNYVNRINKLADAIGPHGE